MKRRVSSTVLLQEVEDAFTCLNYPTLIAADFCPTNGVHLKHRHTLKHIVSTDPGKRQQRYCLILAHHPEELRVNEVLFDNRS
jgi:ABC-type molybdenum transport system ATPase subunit/photorepair protein PhrA